MGATWRCCLRLTTGSSTHSASGAVAQMGVATQEGASKRRSGSVPPLVDGQGRRRGWPGLLPVPAQPLFGHHCQGACPPSTLRTEGTFGSQRGSSGGKGRPRPAAALGNSYPADLAGEAGVGQVGRRALCALGVHHTQGLGRGAWHTGRSSELKACTGCARLPARPPAWAVSFEARTGKGPPTCLIGVLGLLPPGS